MPTTLAIAFALSLASASELPATADAAGSRAHAMQAPQNNTGHDAALLHVDEVQARLRRVSEGIFGSHADLTLMLGLFDTEAGSRAHLQVITQAHMGAGFTLTGCQIWVDGSPLPASSDALCAANHPVYDAAIAPGVHTIEVQALARGGAGPFSYLRDYDFALRSAYDVLVAPGAEVAVQVDTRTRSGLTHSYTDRLAVRWSESVWNAHPAATR